MWIGSRMIGLLVMITLSVWDMKVKKVPAAVLIFAGVIVCIYCVLIERTNLWLHAAGGIIGMLFLIISKITKEGIGYGDSIGITILGVYLGLWDILSVLMTAFFLLLCVIIPLLCWKKMSKKVTLPFFPFLTMGYMCLIFMGG